MKKTLLTLAFAMMITSSYADTTYELVSSTSDLGDEAKCIIVNTDVSKAMVAYASGNNCKSTDISANEDGTITLSDNSTVGIVTIKKSGSSYTLQAENGYYYYAAGGSTGSNNYLKTIQTPSNYYQANITINNSQASIVFTGAARNTIMYNSSSDLFSCYASGQTAIKLYKETANVPSGPQDYTAFNALESEGVSFPVNRTYQLDLGSKYPEITYTYAPENIISINDEGLITPTSEGEVSVTASWAASDDWTQGSANFTVTVTAEELTTSASVDLLNNGYSNQQVVSSVKLDNIATLNFNKGSNTNDPKYYEANPKGVRVYGGGYVTVELSDGYVLTSVELTNSTAAAANALSADTGKLTGTVVASSSQSYNSTWTPADNNTTSVKFTVGNTSGNNAFQAVTVSYAEINSDDTRTTVILSYEEASYDAVYGGEFTAPTLTVDPEDAASLVTYTSSNEKVATVAADGTVKILFPGTTTIKAAISDNETYKDASASYTLNVTVEGTISVADALEYIDGGYNGTATVKGYITAITDMSNTDSGSTYGNATYTISDTAAGSNTLTVFRGYGLNGDKFVTGNEIAVGALVVVQGTILNYNGTPEFTTGSKIIEYTAPGTSAIADIAADEAEAPAEYFNLQGQRVANPAAGGLYIVRQGSKVSKVIL